MKVSYLDYSETHSFSPAIIRYVQNDPMLAPFISQRPDLNGFKELISSKKDRSPRKILCTVLNEQYSRLQAPVTPQVQSNIDLLSQPGTYAITTGHQLNIFTGPLYFIYKIVTAINLARDLKSAFPDKNFVPVYWMATEDHDFAEINHTYLSGKKIVWEKEALGCTGRLDISGLEKVLKDYTGVLGISGKASELSALMQAAYSGHKTLADATREMVNDLFGHYGLVILDADHNALKAEFAGIITDDITGQHSSKNVTETSAKLAEVGIESQVNPREINFFYTLDAFRERIVWEDNVFKVLNSELRFTTEELKQEIKTYPERFSPNVIMRPLYQEVILPNLAYIGGGAEIIYWLQLKKNFDFYKIDFPILVLRNSALIADFDLSSKLGRLQLELHDIFRKTIEVQNEWVVNHSDEQLSLADEWQEFNEIFRKIKTRVSGIDPTLGPSTESVRARLEKAITNLEKKLIRAEKKNFSDALSRIEALREKLFPGGSLQERKENFGQFFIKYGRGFIDTLVNSFKPLDFKFTIIEDEKQ